MLGRAPTKQVPHETHRTSPHLSRSFLVATLVQPCITFLAQFLEFGPWSIVSFALSRSSTYERGARSLARSYAQVNQTGLSIPSTRPLFDGDAVPLFGRLLVFLAPLHRLPLLGKCLLFPSTSPSVGGRRSRWERCCELRNSVSLAAVHAGGPHRSFSEPSIT